MHSLNASPGLSAHSSVEDSGTAVRGDADTAVNPPPHPPEGIGDTVGGATTASLAGGGGPAGETGGATVAASRSEEHTSELQSHSDLVCRLLLEKKKKHQNQCT